MGHQGAVRDGRVTRVRPAVAIGAIALVSSALTGCGVLPGLPSASAWQKAEAAPTSHAPAPSTAMSTPAPPPSTSDGTPGTAPPSDQIAALGLIQDRRISDPAGFVKKVLAATRTAKSYTVSLNSGGDGGESVWAYVDLTDAKTPKMDVTLSKLGQRTPRARIIRIGDRVWAQSPSTGTSYAHGTYTDLGTSTRRLMEALASPADIPQDLVGLDIIYGMEFHHSDGSEYQFRAGRFPDPEDAVFVKDFVLLRVDDQLRLKGYTQFHDDKIDRQLSRYGYGDAPPIRPPYEPG